MTSKEMPGLVNISFGYLSLNERGSLEPVWHPNANKIGYCLKGSSLVSMRTPSGVESFTIKQGEIFFIPQGYIHQIENIEGAENIIGFALNSSNPETMYLSKAVGSISDNVFNSTFNTQGQFVKELKRSESKELVTLPQLKRTPNFIASRYKFDIEESSKVV